MEQIDGATVGQLGGWKDRILFCYMYMPLLVFGSETSLWPLKSVIQLVGSLVSLYVIISSFTSHAPIGDLVVYWESAPSDWLWTLILQHNSSLRFFDNPSEQQKWQNYQTEKVQVETIDLGNLFRLELTYW